MSRERIRELLAWRPVLLFGGGLALAVFEAVQPMLHHPVEWAIVSLAATMMGLQAFARGREPENHSPSNGRPPGPRRTDGPESPAPPENPESRGGPGARAAWVALAVVVALVAPVVSAAPRTAGSSGSR